MRIQSSLYCTAIFLGAFLLFLIQPLVGKILTPNYGGGAQIWAICLLFFQFTLLCGYSITYILSKLPLKTQSIVYATLLLLSALFVHIPSGAAWVPPTQEHPLENLLSSLFLYVALPCLLLSTVSTMLQNWFQANRLGNPYGLYSISNIGSLGSLLFYPLIIEPTTRVADTLMYWTWGYWTLIALIVILAIQGRKNKTFLESMSESRSTDGEAKSTSEPKPSFAKFLAWTGLSMVGSMLLITFTSHTTHNIAPIPLFWVIPLALYLLTFILCFGSEALYHRKFCIISGQCLIVVFYFINNEFVQESLQLPLLARLVISLATLFVLCMICHGEIYRRRPAPKFLPVFYLSVALGGVLGGIFVNLIIPLILKDMIELYILLFLFIVFTFYLAYREQLKLLPTRAASGMYTLAMMGVSILFLSTLIHLSPNIVRTERNFYGSSQVYYTDNHDTLALSNGKITHGSQMIDTKSHRFLMTPTRYYALPSGLNLLQDVMRTKRGKTPLKIGVVGLGVGTVAAYGQPGDQFTFYEIDPKIKDIAENSFYFLKNSKSDNHMIMGDARLSLKQQAPQNYDMIMIDAFNGDAIPTHLLTQEAMAIYFSHLKPDGILFFHITNHYVDLKQVTNNFALKHGFQHVFLSSSIPNKTWYSAISREKDPHAFLMPVKNLANTQGKPYSGIQYTENLPFNPRVGIWSDDYSNLIGIMKFW